MPLIQGSHRVVSLHLCLLTLLILSASSIRLTNAATVAVPASPTVAFGNSSIIGSLFQPSNVQFFGGIPYAKPPIGSLRLSSPVRLTALPSATFQAQAFGPSCLQSDIPPASVSEDCLTLNVFRPAASSSNNASLPVMVWIFGGAFFVGGSSLYNATSLVAYSVERGTPIIVVSLNYRLGPLGFPQGDEVGSAGPSVMNLGLQDSFTAIEWIQRNIAQFGGDKTKVTLFGESSGAFTINVFLRNHNFSGLARAAILQSMVVLPTHNPERSQQSWEQFVSAIPGCSTLAHTNTTIACIRNASTTSILKSFTTSGLNFNDFIFFQPVIDGPTGLVVDRNSQLKSNGLFLPVMIGSNLDEGTLFTPQNTNADANITGFLQVLTAPNLPTINSANKTRVFNEIMTLYPNNASLGSPFNTDNNTFGLDSEYKRFSAIIGDFTFQAARRSFAQNTSAVGAKVFVYYFTDQEGTVVPELLMSPVQPGSLGVPHSAEISFVFGDPVTQTQTSVKLSTAMQDYWISFAVSLDPNDGKGSQRPQWTAYTDKIHASDKTILQLDSQNMTMIPDTFRAEQISYIQQNVDSLNL